MTDFGVDVERGDDGIASVVLRNPARLNAVRLEMWRGPPLAACADVRVAADDARVALPAARLGLGYHFSGVARLVELVGTSAAAELFFTARQYTADEAARIGLVNQVVPGAELDDFTIRYAAAIAANAPLTLRAA